MSAIFFDNRGVAAAHVTGGLPAVIKVAGWNSPATFRAAITGYRLGGQGSFQFLHTLRDVIYVYVFGERMGMVQLNGFAFMGRCDLPQSSTGLDDIYNFYNTNRISSVGAPITVTLGITTALQAFLVSFDVQLVDPSAGLAQFTLSLAYPPKRQSNVGATAAASPGEPGSPGVADVVYDNQDTAILD